jgi:hypothetical protein
VACHRAEESTTLMAAKLGAEAAMPPAMAGQTAHAAD